jgi:D-alanyl-D-alanine carboxypeptidase/D-alanyl-D-alanine-endopeptidase (penicillin-binding protein 4)
MRRRTAFLALSAAAAAASAPPPAHAASLKSELDRIARGTQTAMHVADVRTGRTVYSRRSAAPRPLASTTKLFTARAALRTLGPARRLETAVLATAPLEPDGTVRGDLVLRGDGDPDFGTPAAGALADAVARAGVRRVTGGLVADETLFDTVRTGPTGGGTFDPELGAPLTALSYDRGRETRFGPIRADALQGAARRFDDLLEARGIVLPGSPRTGGAPPGAVRVAAVGSVTVAELVERMLVASDDFVAEMLTKRIAAERGTVGSTSLGARLVQRQGTAWWTAAAWTAATPAPHERSHASSATWSPTARRRCSHGPGGARCGSAYEACAAVRRRGR